VLHKIHRLSATIVATYALGHLFNHLVALRGIDAHVDFMKAYREIYRYPALEALLFLCLTYQIASGSYFIIKGWGQRHDFWDKAQALSGAYLVFFLLLHVGAVLFGRAILKLDTNFYYAAAGLNIAPFPVFFLPYYFLAVVAFFTHVACAFHRLARGHVTETMRNKVGYAVVIVSIVLSSIIVATFSGAFYKVDIPREYQKTFE